MRIPHKHPNDHVAMEPGGAKRPRAMGAHHFMGHRGPHKIPDHVPEMMGPGPAGGIGGGEPEPDADDMAPGMGGMGGGGSPPGY